MFKRLRKMMIRVRLRLNLQSHYAGQIKWLSSQIISNIHLDKEPCDIKLGKEQREDEGRYV